MPCLWVETEEPFEELEADKEKESAGKLILYLPGGRKAFQGEIEAMHGHGNSTWYENKKSWLIKFSGKASLLGMTPSKKYLLISNVKDPSMMRNKLFLDMAKECGLPGALSCEWADLYVNGEYRDETPIGKLMHDFSCTAPDDMYYGELAERVRFFKESEEGVAIMCRAMEDMRNQTLREGMIEVAKKLLTDGTLTLEKIAECVGLSLDEVKKIQAGQSA